jgi:hypothetical protein
VAESSLIRPSTNLVPRAEPHLPKSPKAGPRTINVGGGKKLFQLNFLCSPSPLSFYTQIPFVSEVDLELQLELKRDVLCSAWHLTWLSARQQGVPGSRWASLVPLQRLVPSCLFPFLSARYHDELFVAPGISIMMIDTSLSKRTFLIDSATRKLFNLAL